MNTNRKPTLTVVKTDASDAASLSGLDEKALLLRQQREQLQVQEEQLQQEREQAQAQLRQERIENRAGLLEDAAEWRELAKTASVPETAKEYLNRAKEAERKAAELAAELGLVDTTPEPAPATTRNLFAFGSTKAIVGLVILFLVFCGLTGYFGQTIMDDPMNPTGQSIMKNGPIRALFAFTLTFLSVLVFVFFLYLLFNPLYRLWHSQINTDRTLESLITESPAWALLLFLLGFFYVITSLFAMYYTALFG